jgi:tRNA modification GTPase
MRERALRTVAEADFVVLVRPCDAAPAGESLEDSSVFIGMTRTADLVVASKCDLCDGGAERRGLPVSVVSGEGLAALREALDALAFGRGGSGARLALNLRHVQAIEHAIEALNRAADLAGGAVELCAAELRDALDALGQVLGHVSPDDLIGRIFSQFCIGK